MNVCACDYYWSDLSGLRYVVCGGRCNGDVYCGYSFLNVNHGPTNVGWIIGACDHLWSAKCFQYGLVGYSLHYRTEMVGAWGSTWDGYGSNDGVFPVGACIVIGCMV